MSLQQQERPQSKTQSAPSSAVAGGAKSVGASAKAAAPVMAPMGGGWFGQLAKGALDGLSGWGMNKPNLDGVADGAKGKAQAQAGALAGSVKKAKGPAKELDGALESAAKGETVAQQAQRTKGPVKTTAATALSIAGQMSPEQSAAARASIQGTNENSDGYQSPFVSVALSGIRSDQDDAQNIAKDITGDPSAHGYAAYGSNTDTYEDVLGDGKGIKSPGTKTPGTRGGDLVDAVNDTAAVTQYAAAADLGIKLKTNKDGSKQVQVDWAALEQMDVSADLGMLGGKIQYDNPKAVADNGYKAVMAELESRKVRTDQPGDKKEQFISLTGHSGGGQSSFYTALKLASEGYKNVSLVGVDMAMTPHQREVLQALGVNVTNITSNNADGKGGKSTSEIGEVIRTGMGGGQNHYDLNVERKTDPGVLGRHDITNDANVMTTVRFAQYLDSIGAHGDYSPAMYDQFLKDTKGKGDETSAGTADKDLLSKVTDQRNLPGADQNNLNLGGGASVIEDVVNLLGGKPVENAIKGVGDKVDNGLDKAGDSAKGWFGSAFGKAGDWLGGMANKGMDWLGDKTKGISNFVGGGLEKAGGLAQSLMGKVSGAADWLGGSVNKGLDWLGNGASKLGNTVSNGLDKAGDTAKSWLGKIPGVGGFLGDAADKGLDLLGGGASGLGNLVSGGLDMLGNGAQAVTDKVSDVADKGGSLLNRGLSWLGGGVKSIGSTLSNGLDKAGDWAQSGIKKAASTTGNFLGDMANKGLDALGDGLGWGFDKVADLAGMGIRSVTGDAVTGLQGVGFDTSQIKGLEDFNSTNPSVTRGWDKKLTTGADHNDPTKVQTIDGPSTAPGAGPAAVPPTYTQEFKQNVDGRLDATKDLKPEQRDVVKKHMSELSSDKVAPAEMVAVDSALKGPNAERAMAAYSDLIKMGDKDPKAKERLSPEVMAMLVSGVGERRTDSDRGQAGIMGAKQSRDAAQGLLNMNDGDYQKVMGLLQKAGKDKDGNPIAGADVRAEQALLLKAVAARRDNVKEDSLLDKAKKLIGIESKHDVAMKDLDQFANDIRGTDRKDLIRTTTLMDIDDENTSSVDPNNLVAGNDTTQDNDGLYQRYNDSCAPTTQQILRGEMDPVYALKRHKQGLDNPDPDTEIAKEQGDVLKKHGGDSTLRQGDDANAALGGQITKASLSPEQAQAVRDLTSGVKLNGQQGKDAQAALAALRAKNGGRPTEGEIKSMQANAANPDSAREGVWQGDAAKDLSNDVTHLELQEKTLGAGGIAPHLGKVDTLLKDGQPVPFNVAWDNGGAHAMMMTDTRTDETGKKSYLVSDPLTGATRWVGQTDLKNGTWYQKQFGGDTSTVQDLVVDQNQAI